MLNFLKVKKTKEKQIPYKQTADSLKKKKIKKWRRSYLSWVGDRWCRWAWPTGRAGTRCHRYRPSSAAPVAVDRVDWAAWPARSEWAARAAAEAIAAVRRRNSIRPKGRRPTPCSSGRKLPPPAAAAVALLQQSSNAFDSIARSDRNLARPSAQLKEPLITTTSPTWIRLPATTAGQCRWRQRHSTKPRPPFRRRAGRVPALLPARTTCPEWPTCKASTAALTTAGRASADMCDAFAKLWPSAKKKKKFKIISNVIFIQRIAGLKKRIHFVLIIQRVEKMCNNNFKKWYFDLFKRGGEWEGVERFHCRK